MKQFTLRNGDKGQEVEKLQLALGDLVADGDFGPATEKAVKAYQSSHGLTSDGIAGTKTLTSLEIPVEIGVDLSRHNGTVDFNTMANAGVKYAWIKCTEGTTHVNPGYELKFQQAREAGIQVGGYHFSRPDTYPSLQDATDESLNFLGALSKVGFYKGDLLPVLDVEAGLKTDDKYNVEWTLKWLFSVEKSLGVRPIIYTGKWAYDLYLRNGDPDHLEELKTYPLWIASYNSGVEPERMASLWSEWDVWQWTGSGAVPGVVGKCDINWSAGGVLPSLTYQREINICGLI